MTDLSVDIDCLMLLDEIGCEQNEINEIWLDATLEELNENEPTNTQTNGN